MLRRELTDVQWERISDLVRGEDRELDVDRCRPVERQVEPTKLESLRSVELRRWIVSVRRLQPYRAGLQPTRQPYDVLHEVSTDALSSSITIDVEVPHGEVAIPGLILRGREAHYTISIDGHGPMLAGCLCPVDLEPPGERLLVTRQPEQQSGVSIFGLIGRGAREGGVQCRLIFSGGDIARNLAGKRS